MFFMNNLKDKLVGIERYLYIFDKENTLLEKFIIPASDKLETFIQSLGEKFELYDGYKLSAEEMDILNSILEIPMIIDMENKSYHIVTVGDYNW